MRAPVVPGTRSFIACLGDDGGDLIVETNLALSSHDISRDTAGGSTVDKIGGGGEGSSDHSPTCNPPSFHFLSPFP